MTQSPSALPSNTALARWIIDGATDFAIMATDRKGLVTSWSEGAIRIRDWSEEKMLGETLERISTPQDRRTGRMATEMRAAEATGTGNDERWHLRKNGARFWANGEMTLLLEGERRFVFNEIYVDDAAVQAHMASDHFKAFGMAAQDLAAARPSITVTHPVMVADQE